MMRIYQSGREKLQHPNLLLGNEISNLKLPADDYDTYKYSLVQVPLASNRAQQSSVQNATKIHQEKDIKKE